MGQGQRSRSNFWHAAVDVRGSALPRAEKGNKSYYQSKVFVCVFVIRGHIQIIARMRDAVDQLLIFLYQRPCYK